MTQILCYRMFLYIFLFYLDLMKKMGCFLVKNWCEDYSSIGRRVYEDEGVKSCEHVSRWLDVMINDGSSASRATTTAAAASFPMPWMVSVHLRPSPFLYDGLFCPFGGLLIVRLGLSGAILHWSRLVHFASRLWPPRHPMPDNIGTVLGGYVFSLQYKT